MRNRSTIPLIAFTLAFTGCLLFAYCWFNTDLGRGLGDRSLEIGDRSDANSQLPTPISRTNSQLPTPSSQANSQLPSPNSRPRIWLTARTNVPDYTFKSEALGRREFHILGTTNIMNGRFLHSTQEEFKVLIGSWTEKEGPEFIAIQHTPELCWPSAGWNNVDLKQPKQIQIHLTINASRRGTGSSGIRGESNAAAGSFEPPNSIERNADVLTTAPINFECRVFQAPSHGTYELVVWCSLLSGDLMDQSNKVWQLGKASQFMRVIGKRVPLHGEKQKQFVRCSVTVTQNLESAIKQIELFLPKWLHISAIDNSWGLEKGGLK